MPDLRSETIVAPATASGAAGLAVVRISGPAALDVAARIFRGADLRASASHRAHHGWVVESNGARIDEVLALVLRAPRSYTGEDTVELSCHGSPQVVEDVVAAAIEAGARSAQPGEFTRRAFLNGKLDLAQAEAVADLIAATSRAGRRAAVEQLRGRLSRRLEGVQERLLLLLADVEASIDFVEEGIEFFDRDAAAEAVGAANAEVAALLATAADGELLRSGVYVALAGAPNVGKSSLFNRLVDGPRALVTEHAGTTRDVVRETIVAGGLALALEDTAGLRDSADPVERLGIERGRATQARADIVLWVVDASDGDTAALRPPEREPGATLVVLNKVDRLAPELAERLVEDPDAAGRFAAARLGKGTGAACVAASAKTGAGIAGVRAALVERTRLQRLALQSDALVAVGARHRDALVMARAGLGRAAGALAEHEPAEILAADLRAALGALGEIRGENVGERVLDRIFARFCIGK